MKETCRCRFCKGELKGFEAKTPPNNPPQAGDVISFVVRCPHCHRESDTWLVEEVPE